jgi:hypothetical protein
MTSSNPDPKSTPKSSTNWLATGFFCLLVGGTLAAKTVFLVDDNLEIKTKFAGQNWQLNSQSVKKYAADLEVSTRQYLQPWLVKLDRESTHLIKQTSNNLANRHWCVPIPSFLASSVPDNNSNSLATAHPKASKTDRQHSLPVQPAAEQRWCFK